VTQEAVIRALEAAIEATGTTNAFELGLDDRSIAEIAKALSLLLGWDPQQTIKYDAAPNSRGIELAGGVKGLARWLIEEGKRASPKVALERLLRVVGENTVDQYEVVTLWGFTLNTSTQVFEDIYLGPLDDVPDTNQKRQTMQSFGHPLNGPQAALYRHFRFGPILDTSMPNVGNSPMESISQEEKTQTMRKIAAVLPALIDAPVLPVINWFESDETASVFGGAKGAGRDFRHFGLPVPAIVVDAARVADHVAAYLKLPIPVVDSLRIPLARLNSAKSEALEEETLPDAFIDLGIALEALLSMEKDPTTEIGYRLAMRAAILRGGDAAFRLGTYTVLKSAYDSRSAVAHRGKLTKKKIPGRSGPADPDDFFGEAVALTQELLGIVIKLGDVPDLDGLVIDGAANAK